MNLFLKRLITSIVAAAYLVLALTIRGWWLDVNIIAVLALSVYELQNALRRAGAKAPVAYGWAYAALLYPAWHAFGVGGVAGALALCAVASMAGTLWSAVKLENLLGAALWPIYPALPVTAIFLLVKEIQPDTLMLATFALCFVPALLTDCAAYAFGMAFGKRKLTPISPTKTLEGALGGFLGGIAGALAVGMLAQGAIPHIAWWELVILGILCSAADQIGDLWASLIKRVCDVKDFGRILPGHGGILDRLDGVFFNSLIVLAWALVRMA